MGVSSTPTIKIIVTIKNVNRKSNIVLIKSNKFFLAKFKTKRLAHIDIAVDNEQITNH